VSVPQDALAPADDLAPASRVTRWETIRYALDDNGRTIRLCVILLVVSLSPAVGIVAAVLAHHALMMLLA